jgi:hypothetical protein
LAPEWTFRKGRLLAKVANIEWAIKYLHMTNALAYVWAKLSALYVDIYAVQLHPLQKQPNLKLKTRPKQLLGYLSLAFALPFIINCF